MLLLEEAGVEARGRRGRRRRALEPLRQADGPAAARRQRHGDHLPLAHARPAEVCRRADVLIAAVGRARMVGADWVKPGATVIDVGINRTDDGLDRRRRLRRGRRGRRRDHARARRRRADDDRLPAAQHARRPRAQAGRRHERACARGEWLGRRSARVALLVLAVPALVRRRARGWTSLPAWPALGRARRCCWRCAVALGLALLVAPVDACARRAHARSRRGRAPRSRRCSPRIAARRLTAILDAARPDDASTVRAGAGSGSSRPPRSLAGALACAGATSAPARRRDRAVPPARAARRPTPRRPRLGPRMIDREQVLHVARLARLELTDDEVERMAGELSAILDHIETIGELDLDGVAADHPRRRGRATRCAPTSRGRRCRARSRSSGARRRASGFRVPSPAGMSAGDDIVELTAAQAAAASRGRPRPRRAVRAPTATARPADELNAFTWVADGAAADGRRRRRRWPACRSRVKDLFCTEGVPSQAGSKILEGYRPPYTATVVAAARRRRRAAARQDQPGRVRDGLVERELRLRAGAQPVGPHARARAARAAAAPRPSPPASRRGRSAPTPAARSASPPRCAGSSGSSRPTARSPATG